ncbi:type II CAAX prenyl endopeptidase Rce1 family protein [Leeuwenhoekiella sp. NPDC079379]|uniref:CPBP family glutamic-type intramembrane protease n=1 Tax=Leeuwenhoekiella sp. NPDC079379 TaxID=3364122 RepID=UPI0037C73D9D
MSPKQKTFFKSLHILFSCYLVLALLKIAIAKIFSGNTASNYVQSNLREILVSEPLSASLKILIIAPIFEELMFRTLIKPTHTELILFFVSWPAFMALFIIPAEVHFIFKYAVLAIFISCFTYIGAQLLDPYKARHLRAWLYKHYKWIWILSSIVFGLIHINNYVDAFIINLPLLLHITPRILSGFIFGYVKIKNKHLGWSMALHSINNAIPLSILLLAH